LDKNELLKDQRYLQSFPVGSGHTPRPQRKTP
jgi:hypothetical protein